MPLGDFLNDIQLRTHLIVEFVKDDNGCFMVIAIKSVYFLDFNAYGAYL